MRHSVCPVHNCHRRKTLEEIWSRGRPPNIKNSREIKLNTGRSHLIFFINTWPIRQKIFDFQKISTWQIKPLKKKKHIKAFDDQVLKFNNMNKHIKGLI